MSVAPKGLQGTALALEPRPNAWNQPLAGSSLSQASGHNAEGQTQGSPSHGQTAASASSNAVSSLKGEHKSLCSEQSDQQAAHGEASPYSTGLQNGHASGPGVQHLDESESQRTPGGYATKAQHLAQISELQASLFSSCLIAVSCTWHCMYTSCCKSYQDLLADCIRFARHHDTNCLQMQ